MLALRLDPLADGLDGVEKILEGAEITMLSTNPICWHVPALKFRFTAAPDDEHGDLVIRF